MPQSRLSVWSAIGCCALALLTVTACADVPAVAAGFPPSVTAPQAAASAPSRQASDTSSQEAPIARVSSAPSEAEKRAPESIADSLNSAIEMISSSPPPNSIPPPVVQGNAFSDEDAAALNKLIRSCRKGISVYFKDLTSCKIYENNSSTNYYCASLVKVPFVLYMYQLADAGKLDLEQQVAYAWDYYQGGNGSVIDTSAVGTKFTLHELLEHMIRQSDNAAFMMVKTVVPVAGFQAFMRTLGLTKPACFDRLTEKDINGDICAKDAGIIMEAVYKYLESGGTNAEKFKQDLLHTEQPLMTCPYPMARKIGSWSGATHDMAVVYAPRPYILALCAGWGHDHEKEYTAAELAVFSDISELIATISQKAEPPPVSEPESVSSEGLSSEAASSEERPSEESSSEESSSEVTG